MINNTKGTWKIFFSKYIQIRQLRITSDTALGVTVNFLYIFSSTQTSAIFLMIGNSSGFYLLSSSTRFTACSRHAPFTPCAVNLMYTFTYKYFNIIIVTERIHYNVYQSFLKIKSKIHSEIVTCRTLFSITIYFLHIFSITDSSAIFLMRDDSSCLKLFSSSTTFAASRSIAPATPLTINLILSNK